VNAPRAARRYSRSVPRAAAALLLLAACHSGGSGRLEARPANPTCLAPPRPGTPGVALAPALGGAAFSAPLAVLQAPGDTARFFVVEKRGSVQVAGGGPFLDIRARVNSGESESGLLGMAFHPQWQTNRQAFLSYTAYSTASLANLRSTISRFTSRDGGATLDAASEQVLLTLEQPYVNHNGGHVAFGPDGILYAGFGDGGSGGDPQNRAQNTQVLFGKILRIDVDSGTPYAIPADNPFASGGGRGEIWAFGLRNPWRFSFDRATGDLWAGDVGQDAYEEVDRIVRGGNYGWNRKEGLHCYGTATCAGSYLDPVAEYDHGQGCSITGGYVYRGAALASLAGRYVYGDYCSGTIWALSPQEQIAQAGNISSFAEDAAGELYVVELSGRVLKLVPGSTSSGGPAARLSGTGCVDPSDATRPASGLVPYDVNVALWSDGADKSRWLALPDRAQIHLLPDGDFDLPAGSVVVKEFRLEGVRLETRLMVRHADGGWAGYSYAWNDAQTDAALLADGDTRTVKGKSWTYPSRAQCMQCHTDAAGGTLGLEAAQLARSFNYAGSAEDQLAALLRVGLLDAPASANALSPLRSAGALQDRARSYLHANCAQCHRAGGPRDFPDLRIDQALAYCGKPAQQVAPFILAPGHPEQSALSLRMRALDGTRMPPLATQVVDQDAAQVVEAWIASLQACP
jgi:uncharacterized repeat protein (TIGR03806 family)